MGQSTNFQGNLYALGSVDLGEQSGIVGSVIGHHVTVGNHAQVYIHTGWNTPGVAFEPSAPYGLAKAAAGEGSLPGVAPVASLLLPSYPNPGNPSSTIRYNLARPGAVRLAIYNIAGQRVRTLVDDAVRPAGYYSVVWNGRDDTGHAVASGLYLYRLIADDLVEVRKMTLLK